MNWHKYSGEYLKVIYYIKTASNEVLGPCWPNAGVFHLMDGSGRIVDGEDVEAVTTIPEIPTAFNTENV